MTRPATPSECQARAEQFNSAPYYKLLGLVASSDEPGTSRVVLPFREELTQLYGDVHGGALLTLADSSIMVAIMTTLDEEDALGTVQLSMQFLTPALRSDLLGVGRVTRRGGRIAYGECVISAGEREVARAQGVAFIAERAKVDRRGG